MSRPHSGHRHHRRRGSGRSQHGRFGPVREHRRRPVAEGDDVEAFVDGVIEATLHKLSRYRLEFPGDDYSARIYFCEGCRSLHACVAPRDDLVESYPCPECSRPEVAWTRPAP